MTDETAIVPTRPQHSLGIIQVNAPHDVIVQASVIAKELAKIIRENHLTVGIQGRDYVKVEGWSTMGAMLGVLPREVVELTRRLEDGGYEATVELVRTSDNVVVGRGSALVGMDEKDKWGKPTWANRPEYARRSMAVTRAAGKAYRLGFSWIIGLAGFEPTPAEEMTDVTDGEFTTTPPPAASNGAPATSPPAMHPQPRQSFNPVVALVDAGVCENNNAAASLLNKHIPLDVKTDQDKLVAWGKSYRQWRDAGVDVETAAQNATAGATL